jgi:serine phosphatase RsbU (regulator of sigma subunit)
VTGVAPETPTLRTARVRLVGAAILGALALALALDLASRLLLQSAWFDAYQRIAPRQVDTTPATIVAIDEKSLAELGRWPWPRTLLAGLVRAIDAQRPAAIGVDVVMPEADPLSPARSLAYLDTDAALRERVAALPSNDAVLAQALGEAPTVLMVAGVNEASGQPLRAAPILVRDAQGSGDAAQRALSRLDTSRAGLSSLAALNDAAHGWGLASVVAAQGVVRRVPLVASIGGTLVPALALDMWRVALRAPSMRLATADGTVRGVELGDRFFATDAAGEVRVYFSRHEPDRFVSAADVLAGRGEQERLGRTFVLIGVTAHALGDYAWTPVGEQMPGVELHAQMLENMNDDAFLVRPPWAHVVEAAALLVAGALLVWATPRWPVRYAVAVLVACAAALLVVAYALFRTDRLLFDAATPTLGLVLLFGALLALTLSDTARNRSALQQALQLEREAAARVAGELEAARRIQLDSLPRADMLRDPRVDLAASMEPAQEVGGDLYDFYLLDDHRLFFMLGDVSGKGLSASIFMAVSKALCKSTMLRTAGADLGALLSQANVEVGRDNAAAFFVTLFAGVLDLRSGELDYCNAGHENPWRAAAGSAGVTRLRDGGGPPLCVVDDFAYRAARTRLAPGELLCVVSDGVTEASDAGGVLYGTARVERVVAGVDPAGAAVDALRRDVKAFAGGTEPADDMTVLALRWRGA